MFKKKSPIQISGKWKYYPQRDLETNPITIDDVMEIMAVSNQESGSEYLKKHLNFINTSLEK